MATQRRCQSHHALLWLSRLSRPDISFIVGRLATNVSRWSRWDDRQLHRLISYVHHTCTHRCVGTVSFDNVPIVRAFSDADFASCPWSAKSTSRIIIGVQTGSAFFPVHWVSRKQSSVARSTSEAESIALAATIFGEALHIQAMLQYLLETNIKCFFEQDNEAVIKIIGNKYSVKLRHCNRVHRVNIASISDLLDKEDDLELRYCHTNQQGSQRSYQDPPTNSLAGSLATAVRAEPWKTFLTTLSFAIAWHPSPCPELQIEPIGMRGELKYDRLSHHKHPSMLTCLCPVFCTYLQLFLVLTFGSSKTSVLSAYALRCSSGGGCPGIYTQQVNSLILYTYHIGRCLCILGKSQPNCIAFAFHIPKHSGLSRVTVGS